MENQDAPVQEAPETTATSEATPAPEPVSFENALDKLFDSNDAPETEVTPDAPNPSEEEKPAKEVKPTEEPKEEEPDEEPSLADVIEAKGKPFGLSRRELRQVENDLLIPLRNPDTPVSDVVAAFESYHPDRARQVFQHVVDEAARANPDAWIAALTGIDGLTVAEVKELRSRPQQPQVTEQSDTSTERYLNDLYQDSWKDPANDASLLDDDRITAQAMREVVKLREKVEQGDPETKAKLDSALKELEDLKTQATEFAEHKKAVFETEKANILQSAISEYRQQVEAPILDKVFKDLGLTVTDQDTEVTKEAKEFVQNLFKPQFGNEPVFVDFINESFTGRESFLAATRRVGNLFDQAAALEAKAKTSPQEAQKLNAEAQSLRQRAKDEQAPIKVLVDAAAKEFLQHPFARWAMNSLETISNLQSKFAKSGRPEIIGNTATGADPDAWKKNVSFENDPLGQVLSQFAR